MRHYIEMCLAMCFGLLLSLLLFWAVAQLGYPDLRQQVPELSTLVIALLLALPMAAWMRVRGTTLRLPETVSQEWQRTTLDSRRAHAKHGVSPLVDSGPQDNILQHLESFHDNHERREIVEIIERQQ